MEWTAEGTGIGDDVVRNFIRDNPQMRQKFIELRTAHDTLQAEAMEKLGEKGGTAAVIGGMVLDLAKLARTGLPEDQSKAVADDAGLIMALICRILLDEGADTAAIRTYAGEMFKVGRQIESLCSLAAKLATK